MKAFAAALALAALPLSGAASPSPGGAPTTGWATFRDGGGEGGFRLDPSNAV